MPEELLQCPDCGGLVGATAPSDAGVPCSCFGPVSADAVDAPGLSDTDVVPSPSTYNAAEKNCVICGKNVAGHRRVRDHRGYLCYDCYQKEERELHGDRVRCRSCSRLVKQAVLEDYEGAKICPDCFAERQKLKRLQIKRLGIAGARTRADMRVIYTLGVIAAVLLLIILIHLL